MPAQLRLADTVPHTPPEQFAEADSYATFTRKQLVELSHSMPDLQSAVLLCLAWDTVKRRHMKLGPHAGENVARLSAKQLAELTGKHRRNVRRALAKLEATKRIVRVDSGPGQTTVFALNLFEKE